MPLAVIKCFPDSDVFVILDDGRIVNHVLFSVDGIFTLEAFFR